MEIEYIVCPHCEGIIELKKKHCGIFRHGIYKRNRKQIDQHAPKQFVDKLLKKNKIYGCGNPFQIDENNNIMKCDWI